MTAGLRSVVMFVAGSAFGYWLRQSTSRDPFPATITLFEEGGVLKAATDPEIIRIKHGRPIRWGIRNHQLLPAGARIRLDFFRRVDGQKGSPVPPEDDEFPVELRPAEGRAAINTFIRQGLNWHLEFKYSVVRTGGAQADLVLEDPDLEIMP